jgi:hypothetical protein
MNKQKLSNLYIFLFIISIFLRYFLQFQIPAFNVDEVNLGFNIIDKSYFDLLKPLEFYQSAPPGFLIIIKFITEINLFPQWVNLKLFSFIVSCFIAYIPLVIIKQNKYGIEYLIPYVILLFNPFIIYNSLTLKQYGIDLLGTFIFIYFHLTHKKLNVKIMLIVFWSWFSNAAIFGALAMSVIGLCRIKDFKKKIQLTSLWRIIAPLLALFPYAAYVQYYLSFTEAHLIKGYMVKYWNEFFLPLDWGIFEFLIKQTHAYFIYFINAYEIIGLTIIFLLFIVGVIKLYKKEKWPHQRSIRLLMLMITFHLCFSAFHLYPFSDRLLLYSSALFFFICASLIKSLLMNYTSVRWFILLLAGLLLSSYSTYINFKENDVLSVIRYLKESNYSKVYLTTNANENVNNFNLLTEGYFESELEQIEIIHEIEDVDIVVSRASNKIKPNKNSKDVDFMNMRKEFLKFELIKQLGGYNIYTRKII